MTQAKPTAELFVDIGRHRLGVRATDGLRSLDPLVVLHGGVDAITTLRKFPDALATATGRPVVAYDRAGHGRSSPVADLHPDDHRQQEADRLIDVLDALSIRRAIAVGHSDGGAIALLAAARHPNRITGVLAMTPQLVNNTVVDPAIAAVVDSFDTSGLRIALERHHGDQVDEVFNGWAEMWQRGVFTKASVEHDLARITCPVSVVSGHNDPYGWRPNAILLTETLTAPFALHVIQQVGHAPHLEMPARPIAALHALIATITST